MFYLKLPSRIKESTVVIFSKIAMHPICLVMQRFFSNLVCYNYCQCAVLYHSTARDKHATSMAETEMLTSRDRDIGLTSRDETFKFQDKTETRRLQVSRHDRDVEMHVVINAVVNNVGLTTVATVSA